MAAPGTVSYADASLLGWYTLLDVVQDYTSQAANALLLEIARIMDREVPLLKILPMVASNEILSNLGNRTDYLPTPGTRRFNSGIVPTASKNKPIRDDIALFADYVEVDKEEWEVQNEPNKWRANKIKDHLVGLEKKLETVLWYGNPAYEPGSFMGMFSKFNSLETTPNGLSDWPPNVWNGGATSTPVSSICIMELGPEKVYGIYPKNMPGGLHIQDLGEQTKQIPSGTGTMAAMARYQVLISYLRWALGIQVLDERCVQRICNLNPTVLSANNFDENILIQAKNWLPGKGEAPGTVIFMNRSLKTQVDIRAVSQKINSYFEQNKDTGDIFGRTVTRFQNIPILVSEMMLGIPNQTTETVVQ
jgi:hypothetical protein